MVTWTPYQVSIYGPAIDTREYLVSSAVFQSFDRGEPVVIIISRLILRPPQINYKGYTDLIFDGAIIIEKNSHNLKKNNTVNARSSWPNIAEYCFTVNLFSSLVTYRTVINAILDGLERETTI